MKPAPDVTRLGVATAVVIAALIGGFLVLGSPTEQRARRMDDRRVTDLQETMVAVDLYWTRHSRLPASLDELTAEPGVQLSNRDPVSSEPYAYQTLDSTRYELCASFELESEEISRDPKQDLWAHGAGRHCFQLEAEEIERTER